MRALQPRQLPVPVIVFVSAERLGKVVPEPSKRGRFTDSVEDGFWRVHLAEKAEHEQPVRPVGNEQGVVRLEAARTRAVADIVALPVATAPTWGTSMSQLCAL